MFRGKKNILLILLILFACSGCKSKQIISIGMLVSETGMYSPLLSTGRNGALLAIEEINDSGPIHINLILEDDESETAVAVQKMTSFINNNVEVVICSTTSGTYAKLKEIFQRERILAFSPTVSSTEFSGIDDYLVRLSPGMDSYAAAYSELIQEMDLTKMSVVYDDNNETYAFSIMDNVSNFLGEAGYSLTMSLFSYNSKAEPRFADLATEILTGTPDSVLIIASPLDTAFLCQNLPLTSDRPQIICSPWGISQELLQYGGRSINGIHLYRSDNMFDDSPDYRDFVVKYQSRFGEDPSYQSIINYDAIYLLLEAIRNVPEFSADSVKKELIRIRDYSGIQFSYTLDKYGDCLRQLFRYTVQNGAFVAVD